MTTKHKSSAIIIPIDQAVGKVLAHDITEIRPGQFKGAAFKKGHVECHKYNILDTIYCMSRKISPISKTIIRKED